MFRRGHIVLAKLKYNPWWPGIVINPEDCGCNSTGKKKFWIFWFGDHKFSAIECSKILDFETHFAEKINKMNKPLKCAIQEVLTILADRYNIEYSETSSLFRWGQNGFVTSAPIPCAQSDSLDLPDIVKNALQKDSFKRKHENSPEEDKGIN